MAVTAPDWLTRHEGSLKLGPDGRTWYVLMGTEPQYALVPRPVAEKYGCYVKQTNNGKLIDSHSTGTTIDEALRGGLEDLRKALGW